ncbi:MAG: hypothetical protein EPO22_14280 [Dehalococcoidia bacterium]|nr:MAG: hypothetical protein EPO22_14280 [Dehalococcoidia bacterium]
MDDAPGTDWVEQLMRSFRDRLVGGLYEGVYELEGEPLHRVMDAQAEACVHAFTALSEIPAELDFGGFLERMKISGPSKIELDRVSDDELLWRELHRGECVCPHVRQQVIPLDPKLCICGATWVRLLVERHARRAATVTLVESVATGADNCVYHVTLGESLPARA